jgi:hypothetical protein
VLLAFSSVVEQHGAVGTDRFKAELQPRGPAAAVILDEDQVAAAGEMIKVGKTRS